MGCAVTSRVLLSALVLLSLVAAPVAVAGSSLDAGDAATEPSVVEGQLQPNNTTTTPQHRNPDEVSEDGDLDELQGWLAGRLGGSLRESAVQISQGEYDRARSLVGEEYDGYLAQYVDVAGETRSSADDETGDQLGETQQTLQNYVNASEAFEETYDAYREAKRNGDQERARDLARELDNRSRTLSETSQELVGQYETLGNLTGQSFADSQAQIEDATENLTVQAQEVREEEFTRTRLSVTGDAQVVSFTGPVTLTGRLTPVDGSAPPDTAVLRVAGQRRTVDLGPDGDFSVQYRPVRLPTNATSLIVEYVPAASSPFFAATDTVPVTVESVTPTVAVDDPSQPVAFGDSVAVSGTVLVDGEPVPDAPVVLSVDGTPLGQAQTDADGSVTVRSTLGAAVPAGEVDVSLRAGEAGLAVGPGTATGGMTVRESATTLSLSTDRSGGSVAVSGVLTTADGDAVPGQPVALTLNGTQVGTATTDDGGRYATSVELPQNMSGSPALVARFDGTGTNLASSSERLTLSGTLPGSGPGGSGGGGGGGVGTPWLVVGGVVVVGVLLVLALTVLDLGPSVSADRPAEDVVDYDRRDTIESDDDVVEPVPTPEYGPLVDRLDALTDDAAENPGGAVIRGYLDVRETVAPALDLPDTATHNEFYRAIVTERRDLKRPLGRLAGAFEVAVFADYSVNSSQAVTVLEGVRDVVNEDVQAGGGKS
ncbi:hypothetical protein [Haloarchaeobius sp. HRN-SO-5]|uniref:hypothetical protein n=1 Tax=Haloarchaeobius sp. HRN-SO-5 TaxID=3446118 RepID=UPI003EBF6894